MLRDCLTMLLALSFGAMSSVSAQSVAAGAAPAARSDSAARGGRAAADERARISERLAWMTGCWAYRDSRGRLVEEQWSSPRAGVMFGYSRTTRARTGMPGDTLLLYETTRISEAPDGALVFAASPSGQQPDEFRWRGDAATLDTAITFENPAHDFPQRVRYRRGGVAGDSLVARVEGTRNGTVRGIDFPYARMDCRTAGGRR
jgi:hypothetical protein